MEFLSKESINSKELLKQINLFRKAEYQEKETKNLLTEADKKRGHYIELQHGNLLKIIRKEFDIPTNAVKINAVKNNNHYESPIESNYKDEKGELRTMFILTIDQAKQVLMRESKVVRRAVIQYLNLLEKRIRELERKKGKLVRKQETEAIKMLIEYGNIPKEKEHLYYMTYSKLPYVVLGLKKIPRDDLIADELELIKELESIIQSTIFKGIIKGLKIKTIYQSCKKNCWEMLG